MSVIGTIQRKFLWLLIVLLALAMLAFVLMDSSGPGGIQPGANQKVGDINGDKVKAIDLSLKQQEIKERFPRATDDQVREMAWREFVNKSIFDPRFKSLGLSVQDVEIERGILSDNPHPIARQTFSNPDGTYDLAAVQEFLNDSEQSDKLFDLISSDLKDTKYTSLLKQGVNTPDWLAQIEQTTGSKTVDFDFVQLPYSLIGDEEIEITDKEVEAYARENRQKYESRGGFVLQYVPFDIVPSKADSLKTTDALTVIKDSLMKITDDTAAAQYAFTNSSQGVPPNAYGFNISMEYNTASTITYGEQRKNQILNSSVGDVLGPFVHNGFATLLKIEDKKTVADSARVRHILIPADRANVATQQALADSLATVLKSNKSKFEEFVTEYSTDPGSKDNGGVYDYFPQGQMVPTFNDAAFNNPVGEIDVVQTDYGFHIVEVLSRKGSSTGVKLLPIIKTYRIDTKTRTAILNQAQEFERNSKSEENFIANAEQYGGVQTTPLTDPNATFIPGIGNDFSMLAWANNNSAGAVRLFAGINSKDYVVRLASKSKKGDLDIEQNRVAIENEIRKQKKAELLKQRIEENGGVNQSLSALAQKLGRNVQTATSAKFASSGQGVGFEPELISRLFFRQPGFVAETIDGRNGVYVVDIKAFNEGSAQSIEQVKTSLNNRVARSINMRQLMQELEENGTIKDERYTLYR